MQQLSQSIQQHGVSIERLELCRLIKALKKKRRDLMLQLATASNLDVCEVLMDQVKEIQESIANNERKMNDLEK